MLFKKKPHQFEMNAFCALKERIESISPEDTQDIYVLSFFIYDDEDDPRRPTLTLGYNTNEQCKKTLESAGDAAEAKWNYAFWIQNSLCVVGEAESVNARLRDEWFQSLKLGYSDAEWESNMDRCCEVGGKMTHEFVRLAVRLAQRLHAEGVIRNRWADSIPILIHEVEYYDEIAEQCKEANPPGFADEFAQWIASM
jgi:hypothetical protein